MFQHLMPGSKPTPSLSKVMGMPYCSIAASTVTALNAVRESQVMMILVAAHILLMG